MSRLKGADLGVSLPTGTMNYRGEWSAAPSPAYAANDLVTRNGSAYVASTPPAANDPAAGVLSPLGSTPSAGATAVTAANAASSFTVSAPVLVYAMKWYSITASTGGRDVGIATAISATPTFIAKGSSHSGVVGWDTVSFAAPVLLVPGTTYYAVVMTETTVGKNGLSGGTYGVVTVPNGVWQGASLGISASPAELVFELDDLYWRPLGAIQESVNTVAASGAAVTLPDVTVATMHRVTLTAATPAITLPTPGAGKSFTVELVQDATGGRAPTWATPSGAIRWPGGTAPTITAAANAIDVITFACIGGTNWYGFVAGQAFA